MLEKYSEKVSNSIKKELNSEPVYNKKYLETKINLIRKKLTQILTIIKYQKKAFNVFVYQ